jgi:hypothetical protein
MIGMVGPDQVASPSGVDRRIMGVSFAAKLRHGSTRTCSAALSRCAHWRYVCAPSPNTGSDHRKGGNAIGRGRTCTDATWSFSGRLWNRAFLGRVVCDAAAHARRAAITPPRCRMRPTIPAVRWSLSYPPPARGCGKGNGITPRACSLHAQGELDSGAGCTARK